MNGINVGRMLMSFAFSITVWVIIIAVIMSVVKKKKGSSRNPTLKRQEIAIDKEIKRVKKSGDENLIDYISRCDYKLYTKHNVDYLTALAVQIKNPVILERLRPQKNMNILKPGYSVFSALYKQICQLEMANPGYFSDQFLFMLLQDREASRDLHSNMGKALAQLIVRKNWFFQSDMSEWNTGLLQDVIEAMIWQDAQTPGYLDEQTYMKLLNTEVGCKAFHNAYHDELFRRIKNVDILLQFRAKCLFARTRLSLYVTYLLEISKEDPTILNKVKSHARSIIQMAHEDTVKPDERCHSDSWQRVRGSSSDCHSDSIPWKPRKTGAGHGYHHDGCYVKKGFHRESSHLPVDMREQLKNLE